MYDNTLIKHEKDLACVRAIIFDVQNNGGICYPHVLNGPPYQNILRHCVYISTFNIFKNTLITFFCLYDSLKKFNILNCSFKNDDSQE